MQAARAARPAWNITLANALDVAEITRRLDGLPLAIELAAVRIRVLSPAEILRRLCDALDLLQARTGDRPTRQQTLRAAIAWSFDLLNFENQAAFRRLGVFAGGFSMEAAEQVLAEAPAPWIDVLDAVSILVEHSLLQTSEDVEANTRYGMLEVIRSFALEQLAEAREDDELFTALTEWADRFARDADRHVSGAEGGLWLERCETEHDNFRGAMEWAIGHDPNDLGLRLPEALWRFWELRGHFTEGRLWLERALAAAPDGPPGRRRWPLMGSAISPGCKASSEWHRMPTSAVWRSGASLAIARAWPARFRTWATSLSCRATSTGPRRLQEEALAVSREIGEPLRIALALNNLALVVWNKGDKARATQLLEESVTLKRQEGNRAGLATSLNNLGSLLADEGDYDRAKVYLEETLAIDRELGNPGGIADSLGNLASLASITGDVAHAAALDAEALQLRRDIDDRLSIAYSLESIASTASRAGFAPVGDEALRSRRAIARRARRAIAAKRAGPLRDGTRFRPRRPHQLRFRRRAFGGTTAFTRRRHCRGAHDQLATWRPRGAGRRSAVQPEPVSGRWAATMIEVPCPASDHLPSSRCSSAGTVRIARSPRRERSSQRQKSKSVALATSARPRPAEVMTIW